MELMRSCVMTSVFSRKFSVIPSHVISFLGSHSDFLGCSIRPYFLSDARTKSELDLALTRSSSIPAPSSKYTAIFARCMCQWDTSGRRI